MEANALAQRVGAAYQQLSSVASDLNQISDELGKSISEVDGALKKLNLGVEVWVQMSHKSVDPDGLDFYIERVGYTKVNGIWGIGLRTESGREDEPDRETTNEWLFNDAPRTLRLAAIGRLPDLLEALSKEAVTTTAKLKNGLAELQLVAGAVKGATKNDEKKPDRSKFWGGGEPSPPAGFDPGIKRVITRIEVEQKK
jgi:hypothetical protein